VTSIKAIWDQLVADTVALGVYADARALPVNVISDLKFLDHFPGIQMPACLIVFMGRDKTIRGSADERDGRWNAIFVARDADGSAYAENIARVEAWEAALCDREILSDSVVVLGTAQISPAVTNPRFSVYQLAFSTRQAEERVMGTGPPEDED